MMGNHRYIRFHRRTAHEKVYKKADEEPQLDHELEYVGYYNSNWYRESWKIDLSKDVGIGDERVRGFRHAS